MNGKDIDRWVGGIIDAYTLAPNGEDEKREAVEQGVLRIMSELGADYMARIADLRSALDEVLLWDEIDPVGIKALYAKNYARKLLREMAISALEEERG